MMRDRCPSRPSVVPCALRGALLAVAIVVVAAAGLHVASGQSSTALDPSCGLQGQRHVTPRVLAEGEAVSVTVEWSYGCQPEERQPVDLILLVEVSAGLNDPSVTLPRNLRDGLLRLVDRLPADAGRVGMATFDARMRSSFALAGGAGPRESVRDALRGLEHTGSGFANPVAALDFAANELAAATGDKPAAVVLVDVGGSLPPDVPMADVLAACRRVSDGGASLAVLSLPGANERLEACASDGFGISTSHPDGRTIPERMMRLASHWIGDPAVLLTELHERTAEVWTYVVGSGVPRGPDALRGSERIWQEYAPAQSASHRVSFRLTAGATDRAVTRTLAPPGGSFLALVDRAGHAEVVSLSEETVCVHPVGAPGACGAYSERLTETAAAPTVPPGATPTASTTSTPDTGPGPTHTAVGGSATPTVPQATTSPTPTPSSRTPMTPATGVWIALPLGLNGSGIR